MGARCLGVVVRRLLVATVVTAGLVLSTMALSSAPASAAISGASLTPLAWGPGATNAVTASWSESSGKLINSGNWVSVEVEWDWSVSFTAANNGAATWDGAAKSFTCPGTNIVFQSAGFAQVGTGAKCTYTNSPGGPVRIVKLEDTDATNGYTFTGGNSISVTFPSGVVTAATTAKTYRWTLVSFGNNAFVSPYVTAALSSVTETFPPQPPTNVRAVKQYDADLGYDVIRVTWDAPKDPGTLPVTHYSVYGGTEWGNPLDPGRKATCLTDSAAKDFTSCVVSSRSYGYSPALGPNLFWVKAFNGLGWSGESPASNMVLVEFDPTPASAPRNPVAVAGWNSVTVAWEPPASRGGGGAIMNYLVISDPGRNACITSVVNATVGSNPLSCTFTSLRPGTKYRFQVQALNGNGWGTPSSPTNEASPYNLRLTSFTRVKQGFLRGGDSDVTVRGVAPGYAPGTRVNIWYRVGPNGTWVQDARAKITVTAGGTFRWEREFPRRDNGKPLAVRVSIAPVTADGQPATDPASASANLARGWSNEVQIGPVT